MSVQPTHHLETDADYFGLLTRKLFHSGFNKTLVDKKWPAFVEAFDAFDPRSVAAFSEAALEALAQNSAIVRHRRKLRATVANAQHFVRVADTHGSWLSWLQSLRSLPYDEKESTLCAVLTHCGPNTIFYFLLEAGEVDLNDKPEWVK